MYRHPPLFINSGSNMCRKNKLYNFFITMLIVSALPQLLVTKYVNMCRCACYFHKICHHFSLANSNSRFGEHFQVSISLSFGSLWKNEMFEPHLLMCQSETWELSFWFLENSYNFDNIFGDFNNFVIFLTIFLTDFSVKIWTIPKLLTIFKFFHHLYHILKNNLDNFNDFYFYDFFSTFTLFYGFLFF